MDGRTTIVDFGARLFQYVLKLKKSDFDACADEGETSGRGGPMQRASSSTTDKDLQTLSLIDTEIDWWVGMDRIG